MKEADLESVADLMFEAIQNRADGEKLAEIRERVFFFNQDFPLPE
jgi:glycine/serine hydroxymethyltransferase